MTFRKHLHVQVEERAARRPVQEPWPLQAEAIEDAVEGLSNHDRGRLVMACGTGKTFTSLRIAEQVVQEGQRILFAAPTIALVSQARREWLRQTTRKLQCIVVCSDPTAGGRNENEDIRISELECPVSTGPAEIARLLRGAGPTRVTFCTYQSLRRVTEAQADHGAPEFALAIADEAHRTTGVLRDARRSNRARKVDFQEFHDDERLRARKRLYMTATPRIYTARSKGRLASRGIDVADMGDHHVYGPELHRLPFAKAVEHRILSDYRVIVLGVSQASVTPGLRRRLEALHERPGRKNAPATNEMSRVLGVSLAVNGVTEGTALEQPGKLTRTLAFANSILRSKWYASALMESQVKRATTRRMRDGRAMKVTALHLDASASALRRNQELRALAQADRDGECRVLCNVKLFTEGVDVPQLDAVAFLDPRNSQVDVVQAVGRVMRKAPGKRFGYIIIPVIVEPGRDVAAALAQGTEGYSTVGRVLRALQAHDSRLAESPATFVRVYESRDPPPPEGQRPGTGDGAGTGDPEGLQGKLDLKEAEQGIFAHVAAASGLGKPGQLVADEIADAVRRASTVFQEEELEGPLADALELAPKDDGGAKGVCTIAALMLANACLLQRRLRDEPQMKTILRLDKVAGASHPVEVLAIAWESILEKDYAPVFGPALAVLGALREGRAVSNAIRVVAECANRVADSLSDLGYDHAGPLYHRILGTAKSDGAFYTNNLSAIMLARLALTGGMIDWSDSEAVKNLRIIDPACGTGTLLMACIQAIKARVARAAKEEMDEAQRNALHKLIVENMLCGLDINQHGVQLAACNMTLGAPTVDYERMNLVTMPHGPQGDGSPRAGSLELLTAADGTDLRALAAPRRSLEALRGEQVSKSKEIRFPLHDIDGVIMNAPFTDNRKRSRKFGKAALREMQEHEIEIRDKLLQRDPEAGTVLTTNSIRTFFTPLADKLLRQQKGFLAKVLPVTACTGAAGLAERRFLAKRFHIERIITTHDPKRIAFSENTSITESLLICRRRPKDDRPPTEFVALRKMPASAEEAIETADAITAGRAGKCGSACLWPAARVQAGNWTPVQWYDPGLAEIAWSIEESPLLERLQERRAVGPAGQRIQDAYSHHSEDKRHVTAAERGFHSVSSAIRRTLKGTPDVWYVPRAGKENLAARYALQRSRLLVPMRFYTVAGRLTGLWAAEPSFGWWMPVAIPSKAEGQALAAWFNSTPVRMMLLNRRARKLTYPVWQVAHWREIRVPKLGNPAWDDLTAAYREVCETAIQRMQNPDCPVRCRIDNAAAAALGRDPDELADWRRRIAAEPTVSGRAAI